MIGAGALPPGALFAGSRAAILPALTLTLMALLVIPIAPALLDAFFVLNILVALLVLMVALGTEKPLDFSAFPTVLLFATLLRLALNVASTRIVLVSGHEGTDAAGHVIEAFGNFLIGGNYVVGIFVFAILVIINLVVVTKGAGRVSEVSARFTLDALPGKQMAIDADLAAGILDPEEAKARRQHVATEADFYGAMDGASKFVKGDAIAALLVLIINILGGLILGVAQHGLSLSDAAAAYIILAIGDGLVAQVPSLLLSIATAVIVTRVSSSFDLTGQLTSQFSLARAWVPVSAILAIVGLVPGMPHFLILGFAGLAGAVAWWLSRPRPETALAPEAITPEDDEAHDFDWSDISDHAPLSIEIGFGLIDLVNERSGAPLVGRITNVRRQMSEKFGFLVPPVRIRDSLDLPTSGFRLCLGSMVCGEGELMADQLLALEPSEGLIEVEGTPTSDPAFGLPARWIAPERRTEAVAAGYTVVDPATALATCVSQLVSARAADLFGHEEAHNLVSGLEKAAPQLAQNLVPGILSLQTLTAVLQRLLEERVPVRDFRRIAEALSLCGPEASENERIEAVRRALGGLIIQRVCAHAEPLNLVTFDGDLEALLLESIAPGVPDAAAIEPKLAEEITSAFVETAQALAAQQTGFALVTSPALRRRIFQLLRAQMPDLAVLAFDEIPDDKAVNVVSIIGQKPAQRDAALQTEEVMQ